MASCSLFQPLISAGVTSQSLVRSRDVNSSHASSAMVSSTSYRKVEAASMRSSASVKTQRHEPEYLVSQFWSMKSRRGLRERVNTSEVACRHGSSLIVEARLFGPAIFEAAKLKVLFLGADKKHPQELPRIYTLTHSDVTSKITLAISREINKAQLKGWYSKLQRDEVVAEWRKVQGKMTLHVHCHISGGNLMHNLIANLRFYIFRKELPVVLEAFRHGDEELLKEYPDLDNSLVWVYFHSNVSDYNRLECWGPLVEAAKVSVPTLFIRNYSPCRFCFDAQFLSQLHTSCLRKSVVYTNLAPTLIDMLNKTYTPRSSFRQNHHFHILHQKLQRKVQRKNYGPRGIDAGTFHATVLVSTRLQVVWSLPFTTLEIATVEVK